MRWSGSGARLSVNLNVMARVDAHLAGSRPWRSARRLRSSTIVGSSTIGICRSSRFGSVTSSRCSSIPARSLTSNRRRSPRIGRFMVITRRLSRLCPSGRTSGQPWTCSVSRSCRRSRSNPVICVWSSIPATNSRGFAASALRGVEYDRSGHVAHRLPARRRLGSMAPTSPTVSAAGSMSTG